MGHQRIGTLPTTRTWKQVIDLIVGGADVRVIAAATSDAVEASLTECSNDRAVRQAFFLLARVPAAARQSDFGKALARLGVNAGSDPNLVAISAAFVEAIERRGGRYRSDLGEMAALSAVESLHAVAGRSLNSLFGENYTSPVETKATLAGLATVKQFGILAQDFFARMVRRHLDYYLSRELPNHVGIAQRFSSLAEHDEFDRALEVHCREVARIVTRFAGEWLSKAEYEGDVTEAKAGGFVHIALGKVRAELRLRRESLA